MKSNSFKINRSVFFDKETINTNNNRTTFDFIIKMQNDL